MKITKIADSHINHGADKIIMTVTIDHEVAFSPADVVKVLEACASDNMAKVINQLGAIFNKDQFAECYAANDIDEQGREFIENMHYFLLPKETV
jgi:uncharacterized protein YaiI (UPF0178 family)